MTEVVTTASGPVTPETLQPSAEQSAAQGRSWSHAQDHELDAVFGKLIRTVTAGESFGELALLQQSARRTASVLTSSPASDQRDSRAISLLRVARTDHDAAVSPLVLYSYTLTSQLTAQVT